MRPIVEALCLYLETHAAARWLLANIAGWSAGLYAAALGVQLLGGLIGLLLGGGLAGLIVGGAQWWALKGEAEWLDGRWVRASTIGGMLGALPAFVAGGALIVGHTLGFCIVGAVFGGIIGAAQYALLNDHVEAGGLWVLANVAGGALCGVFSLAVNPLYLPVCCTLGPLLFAGITGAALLRWRRLEAVGGPETRTQPELPAV